jgi:anionic cell wall polymer biosynthesis LytR-Cps2A-Psr (LCP) family protein
MATVVGVMDREGWSSRTDNIVVVDPGRRRLVWVPRDLWVDSVQNRVNTAFARGGHDGFRTAMGELGFDVRHSVCVQREAVELLIAGRGVRVPVEERLEFWYPLSPTTDLEDGRKLVRFDPPSELLAGERIHQWLGARVRPGRKSSDLERIARQQVFVRALLEDGIDPGPVHERPELVSTSSPAALDDLASVDADWTLGTLGRVATKTIDGMMVLVLRKRARWLLRVARLHRGLRRST